MAIMILVMLPITAFIAMKEMWLTAGFRDLAHKFAPTNGCRYRQRHSGSPDHNGLLDLQKGARSAEPLTYKPPVVG
jgi:hypothetical protein